MKMGTKVPILQVLFLGLATSSGNGVNVQRGNLLPRSSDSDHWHHELTVYVPKYLGLLGRPRSLPLLNQFAGS